jgi:hypothetical protein
MSYVKIVSYTRDGGESMDLAIHNTLLDYKNLLSSLLQMIHDFST